MKTILSVLIALVCSISLVQAQTADHLGTVIASDGASDDNYGYSVAISGEYAVVGAKDDAPKGAVYIYHYEVGVWVQQQKISSPGVNNFGYSVAISDDKVIVGCFDSEYMDPGHAYIYHLIDGSWTLQASWGLTNQTISNQYGRSVSIKGDYAAVGDYGDNAAYIYHWDGNSWLTPQKLTAGDGVLDNSFGYSVALSDDCILVGATGDNNSKGSVYAYNLSGSNWTYTQKLTSSDGVSDDYFGGAVAISNNTAIVGADGKNSGKGSAYIFNLSGGSWTETQILDNQSNQAYELFGSSVAISGDYALVGVSGANDSKGRAHVFQLSNNLWTDLQTLSDSQGQQQDAFGTGVAISVDKIIVGIPGGNAFKGCAFAYLLPILPVMGDTQVGDDISNNAATINGTIFNDNGNCIVDRGICWNKVGIPTKNDSKSEEQIIGSFSKQMTNLEPNTTYYVRSYASNIKGTNYGTEITFATSDLSIAINNSAKISDTQYTFTSEINNPDSIEIVDKGIVWGSNEEPTVFDHIGKVRSGEGSEIFTAEATGMFANSSFYVRSYITTYQGTYYSDQIHFGVVPILPNWALILLAGGFVITGGWFVFRKFM